MVSSIVNGITISKWQTLIAAAIVLTSINLFIKPIIKLIMLPINILTLGIFTLFINAFLLKMVQIVKGFYIKDFFSAFVGAIILSIIYLIVEKFIITKKSKTFTNSENSYTKAIDNDNVIDVEGNYEKDENDKNNNV
jgi:putative membrane protein